jgi:nucleoside phosphorylase
MANGALQHIADAAWRETARVILSALSRRPGELGEAGRTLAGTLDLDALPRGVPALARYLAERVPEGLRASLENVIDWELHTFRGGRQVEVSHRLESIAPAAFEEAAFLTAPQAMLGFDESVSSVDLAAPHSMGDLTRYANAYLGRTFVNDAIDAIEGGRDVELHNGTAVEAIATLRERGASTFHQLFTPKLHFQIILGVGADDELRYAIACDDGHDMFRHLEKVLRAARSGSGRRIDPARLCRFDHRPDEVSYRPARFRRCFESSGVIPPQVTVGFKNALLGALRTRVERAAQVRALQRSATLPRELLSLRDLDPRELLRPGARCTAVAELLSRAKAERREVLLVRNPYGEAAVAMGALFRECGVTDVLVYGTAASLDRASQVGELHFASQVTSADGAVQPFQNHALDARFGSLHAQPATRLHTKVVNVRSPLDEFDRDIEQLRADGHHLVEMELAGLLRGLSGVARVAALHVVSDVPQSEDTLEGFSPTRAERALDAAVDVWVETFGIFDVELADPARSG